MKRRHGFWLLAGLSIVASVTRAEENAARKIIYHGWDSPDTAYVRAHWAEMEKLPFDGAGIRVALDRARPTRGDGSTANLLGWQTFGTVRFSSAQFAEAAADLQAPRWTKFTDNFLPVAIATRDQDQGLTWFDDARWATIEANWRVLLRLARDGHCRGILFDAEHYDYECELFSHAQHYAQRTRAPLAEYTAKARRRGQQLGAALREIFPAIVVGMHYGYALPAREPVRYALLPAFLDGLLAASAPEATFVDLWEFGHGCTEAEDFEKAVRAIQTPTLTAEPDLYRRRIRVGSSLRLDFAPRGKPWSAQAPERNYFTPARFGAALTHALRTSERYVWIYSEEPRFFPPGDLPAAYLESIQQARRR